MKLKFTGFLIKNIVYELKEAPTHGEYLCDMTISDGEVQYSPDKVPSAVITITANGFSKNGSEKEKAQDLKISIDYIFEIISKEKDMEKIKGEEFKSLIQDYAMNFCLVKTEDLIKQITTLDYGRPIIIHKATMPTGIKLIDPKELKDEKKDKNK